METRAGYMVLMIKDKDMRVAFGAVVYKEAFQYYREFVEAINNQDLYDFDIILLNDNLEKHQFEVIAQDLNRKVVEVLNDDASSIAENRLNLIRYAIRKGYDLLIIGDFDDSMSENRMSSIKLSYDQEYTFYYNDLFYLDSKEMFFTQLPSEVANVALVYEQNFIGFGNSALNLNNIDGALIDLLYSKQTLAFDWMLYSMLLLHGHKGKKIDGCQSYYRIHDCNTAGDMKLSIDGLKKEIEIKVAHYSKLVTEDDPMFMRLLSFYSALYDSFENHFDVLMNESIANNHYWWGRINMNLHLNGGVKHED